MKYFRLNFAEAFRATAKVWEQEDAAGVPRTLFSISATGLDATVTTRCAEGMERLRQELRATSIPFTEVEEWYGLADEGAAPSASENRWSIPTPEEKERAYRERVEQVFASTMGKLAELIRATPCGNAPIALQHFDEPESEVVLMINEELAKFGWRLNRGRLPQGDPEWYLRPI
ncbi:MAG: hypothetical protein BWY68_00818 [bacterium ADurb.Bin400]|nr:MAG: hypothetical protein BWY68_00818 [bacterium ADurb.Bin400]